MSGTTLRQDTYVRVVTPGPLQGKVGYLRSCPPHPGPDAALGVEGLHAEELGRVEGFKPRDLLPAEQPQEAQ